jgi:tRNA-specific 2-thiouridylase
LGLSGPSPLYVLRVEPDTRRVVVGPDAHLHAWGVDATGANWLRHPEPGEALTARVRHRGARVPCVVRESGEGTFSLDLRAPARAVAPGQSVVVYAGDEVVGGGIIRAAARAAA